MVTAVIAAFCEEDRIGATVRAVAAIPAVDEVVVVDDGSRDRTAEEAQRAGARVLRGPRRGKAEAVAAGVAATNGDVLLLLDADLGDSAAAADLLLTPVLEGRADVAVAVPTEPMAGGFGFAKRAAARGIERLTGVRVAAPLSGQRALRRSVWDAVGDVGRGWELEVRCTVRALRAGFRLLEVPVPFRHRPTGRNLTGFVHRGQQWLAVRRALASLAREQA
jgi:glycosyltransferase involved in cell wall biosynthesis